MYRSFFGNLKWFHWSVLGSILILSVTWYKVQLDVEINEWFGTFYNMIQKALAEPGSVSYETYLAELLNFAEIAVFLIVIAVILEFYIQHYIFRWRKAMNDYYMQNWHLVRHIEGASQRVQEDTMRFARIMEGLGVSFMRSIMTLMAFLPILWGLSAEITELPVIGQIDNALIFVAVFFAVFGTVLLAVVGIKLPGLEFQNQKVEAAYRKELVLAEDSEKHAHPKSIRELFGDVRTNYFRLYLHYLYFGVARWSYLQFGVVVPYIALGPTIVSGAITLGMMQQIVRAFGRVESSFQFLVNSWSTIVELISIYKRLRAFEVVIRVHQKQSQEKRAELTQKLSA
ncbi:peptide antibiotic transporter SbmA [Pseudovibrio sp. Ad26]|uniref:peptide antibiotic transporter SbmA n=1 Tax=Pseudovibrio sp. Ad26 TaxID=989410 RepID=UPI0007AE482D|nr:peptide antibiotic transporter SbmA [Pseudovibrio sp. Ad26]KZL07207.1 Peptide antibiotic transporter SbmA [Pseudovibrio sp. Ad26]